MAGSVLDKNRIWEVVFVLDEAWLTLSGNVNSQHILVLMKIPTVHDVLLHDLKVHSIWSKL
jgi:hypothetical protein